MPDYIKYNPSTGYIVQKWRSVDPSVVDGLDDIIQINRNVYDSLTKYHLVDSGAVREMTANEKSALDDAEAQFIASAKAEKILALDNSLNASSGITLTKVENAIDNIGNLNDAKVFLKNLCRWLVANWPGE